MGVSLDEAAHYAALARDAGRRLEGAPPQEVLGWAASEFGDGFCLTASMGDALLIDMASKACPGVDVVFLDTGYHFPETLATRDRVAERYKVNVLSILPRQSVPEQDRTFGARLHDRDPDACCSLRKVEPLRRALSEYKAWASGIRRDETTSRANAGVVEWDSKRSMVKVNPLACWTQEQADEYVMENDVEVNPLIYQGYPSIGCAPCTAMVADGQDPRTGRWLGRRKMECGLHVD